MAHHGNEISWLHQWWHTLMDNPQAALFVVGAIIGWAIWWMRSMFVTQQTMKDINIRNSADHNEIKDSIHGIREDVSWMKGRMEMNHPNNKDK